MSEKSSSSEARRWLLTAEYTADRPSGWLADGPLPADVPYGNEQVVMAVREHQQAMRAVRDVELAEMHAEHLRLREAAQAVLVAWVAGEPETHHSERMWALQRALAAEGTIVHVCTNDCTQGPPA